MSRIRTIKPEFWSSEQVVLCSPCARLLFIGIWNFADDHGVHPLSYLTLKAKIFPGDSFSISEIKTLVEELISNDLLLEFCHEDKKYILVTGWETHQKVDKPTYRYPLPC